MWDRDWEQDFEKAWEALNSYEAYTSAQKKAELQRKYTILDYDLAWARQILNSPDRWEA